MRDECFLIIQVVLRAQFVENKKGLRKIMLNSHHW